MRSVLITGGAGFFGGILKDRLLADGFHCVNVDIVADNTSHPHLETHRLDIRDRDALEKAFAQHSFDCVFHCAAMLAHAIKDKDALWASNVEGTRNIAQLCQKYGVPKVVFTSSNCLWAKNFHRPVVEEDTAEPQEVYGLSKWEGEKVLDGYSGSFRSIILRTPTIIDCGRLGLLAILFEFIREGRKVWTVGGGHNRYQFIYAPDLADACVKALDYDGSGVFNVGSDNVRPLREVFKYVVDKAGTGARVASLPKGPTLLLMRLAHILRISPLGPYHYKMISEDFEFDTTKIKEQLGWRPTLTNEEMLLRAYRYFDENYERLRSGGDVSAHKQPARMGAIRILKWIS